MELENGESSRTPPPSQEFPMAYRHPRPDAAIFSAGNRHLQPDAAFFTNGNLHQTNPTIWAVGNQPSGSGYVNHFRHSNDSPAAGNQINASNIAMMNNGHVTQISPRYSDTLLEQDFSRLNIMPSFVSPPPYDGGSSSSGNRSYSMFNQNNGVSSSPPEWRDIQRMWTQSPARGRMGLSMPPQITSGFEFFIDGSNSNGNSSFTIPNLYNNYERNLNLNLNGYVPRQSLGVGSFLTPNGNNGYSHSRNRSSPANRIPTNNYAADCCNISICRPRQRWSVASFKDLAGKIFLMSKDQQGCRLLQAKFVDGTAEEIQMIISEVKDHICELMVDQFGNYLVHKVFAASNQEQITQFLFLVIKDEDRFLDICVDSHGTRSVQKLLEFLTTQEQRSRAISALRRITLPLTQSMNGHHVIEYCLKNFSVEDNKQILNEVADNFMDIALDKSGCCVLQQCVERATGEPRDRLIAEITSNSLHLCRDPYGNYVVQYIVGQKIPRATAEIMAQLSGSFVSISMSKYGSNVVEKFLKDEADDSEVVPIIEEIICSPDFVRLLQDPFGNYVAQTAFEASKGALRNALISRIESCYQHLHSHPHGKRVISCIRGGRSRV